MNHLHHHNHHSSNASGKKLFWTILFNVLITIAEFVGGLISGYLALIADAVHNLSDVAALILAWFGIKGSQLPATKRSTFGFKRIEVMTALISATALVVIAVFILIEAYKRFIDPQPIKAPYIFMTVAAIGLLGNVVSIWLLHSEKKSSLNMKTAFLHMLYDALSSFVVLIGGIIIILTGWYIIDVVLTIAIALMIFWSSYLVIKEAVWILLEAVPADIDFDKVHKAIRNISRVNGGHDLHIWSLSSKDIALSCHVTIDQKDLLTGEVIIADINNMLAEQFGIGHGTIQLEAGECDRNDILCQPNDNDRE